MGHFISALKVGSFIGLSFAVVTLLQPAQTKYYNPCAKLSNQEWIVINHSRQVRKEVVERLSKSQDVQSVQKIIDCNEWLDQFTDLTSYSEDK